MRRDRIELQGEGLRGVNAFPARVGEAFKRLREDCHSYSRVSAPAFRSADPFVSGNDDDPIIPPTQRINVLRDPVTPEATVSVTKGAASKKPKQQQHQEEEE